MKIVFYLFSVIFLLISQISQAEQNFLSIADIHFDPFSICHISFNSCKELTQLSQANPAQWNEIFEKNPQLPSKTGKDTNYALLKIMLSKIKLVNKTENPVFALIIGDFLAHNFRNKYMIYTHDFSRSNYQSFVKKTMIFITNQIKAALPNINIYPVLGNNDSYNGDYHHDSHGIFLRDTASTWVKFLNDKNIQQIFLKDFPRDGYYAIHTNENPKIKIILMNSVLFSINASDKNLESTANAEIKWLHQQLTIAKTDHQSVFLVFHIPPGVNIYNTLKKHLNSPETFWKEKYTQLFLKEVSQFSENINAILYAHIHRDIQQLLPMKEINKVPLYITPAISPIFGNMPEFRLFFYTEKTNQIDKKIQFIYMLNNNTWERYENTI